MAEREPARGAWHWPVGLAAALLGMIGISLVFLAIAVRHPDAEVVEDAYAAGLAFDAELAERRRAEELGLRIEIRAEPAPGGSAEQWVARVRVLEPGGEPRTLEAGTLQRIRPAEGGLDALFPLAVRSDGLGGSLVLPRPGRWLLEARVELGGETLVARRRLWRP